MKDKQLFDLMGTIDEEYIEAARKRANRTRILRDAVRAGVSVAACAAIVVGIFLARGYHGAIPTPPVESSGPIDTAEPTPSDSFETETCVVVNGLLLSYTGTDTDVVIPDGVEEITAASFHDNPSVEKFKTVHLSSTVEKIDEDTFSEMKSLEEITVSEDNPVFESRDGILGLRDGTLYFTPSLYLDADMAFFDIIEKMVYDVEKYENTSKIVVGAAELEIRLVEEKLTDDFTYSQCYMTSISVFGHKITFDGDGENLYGNFTVDFIQTDDVFIMQKAAYHWCGSKWIFTKERYYEIHDWERYNDPSNTSQENTSVTSFEKRDDGTIGYAKGPMKYIRPIHQAIGDMIGACTGLDEFAREEGYITIEDGEIRYNAERRYTASELYDLEEEFQLWLTYPWDGELAEIETMEELFAYNRAHFETAVPE